MFMVCMFMPAAADHMALIMAGLLEGYGFSDRWKCR